MSTVMQLKPVTAALKLLFIGSLSLQLAACGGEGSTVSNSSPSQDSNSNQTLHENKPGNKSEQTVTPELKEKIYITNTYKPLVITSKSGYIIPFSNLNVTDGDVEDIIMLSDKAIGVKLPTSAQGAQSIEFTDTSDNSVKRYEFEVTDPQQTFSSTSSSGRLLSHGFNKADNFLYTQPIIVHKNILKNISNSASASIPSKSNNYCQGLTESTGKLIFNLPSENDIRVIIESAQQTKLGTFNQYDFLYKDLDGNVSVYATNSQTEIIPDANETYYVSCVVNMPTNTDYKYLSAELIKSLTAQNASKITSIIKRKYQESGKSEQQATEKAEKKSEYYYTWYQARLAEQLINEKPLTSPQLGARQFSNQLLTKSIIDEIDDKIAKEKLEEKLEDKLNILKELDEVYKLVKEPKNRARDIATKIQVRVKTDWFSAEAMFIDYEPIYHHDIEKIKSKNYSPELIKPSLDYINKKYNEAQYTLEQGTTNIGKIRISNNLYSTYLNTKRHCRRNPDRQNWQCELLQPINDRKLDRVTMKTWSLDELRELYTELQHVRGNS